MLKTLRLFRDGRGQGDASSLELEQAFAAEADRHQQITAQQIQKRIEQAKARIRAASADDKAALVREEVRSLAQMSLL